MYNPIMAWDDMILLKIHDDYERQCGFKLARPEQG